MKATRETLVVKRRAILNGLREPSADWSAMHLVCKEIAEIDRNLGQRIRTDFLTVRGEPRAPSSDRKE